MTYIAKILACVLLLLVFFLLHVLGEVFLSYVLIGAIFGAAVLASLGRNRFASRP